MQINRELDNIKAQIIKHYQRLSDREAFVTAEMVRNSHQGFGSEYETLLSAFDKDIAIRHAVYQFLYQPLPSFVRRLKSLDKGLA